MEACGLFGKGGRHLRVVDPLPCSHPLKIARADFSFMAFEVFMVDRSRKHISNGLEASMRVVRETSGELYFEEIKHQEGIHI